MSNFVDPGPRRSGRTTRQALAYVNECLGNVGKEVMIIDHTKYKPECVRLARMVHDMLKILGIDHSYQNDGSYPSIIVWGMNRK